jgi:flavin-dependent dehydrogenase
MGAAPRTQFDALIVGAGLAGAAAAILLARAGWSVALVEKQRFPRRKVCGECIAASNLPLLAALGIGDAFDACAGAELRQVTLMRGERALSADLPAAACERQRWGRALGRETLDTLLLEQARAAGACVFQPWVVRSLEGSAGAWQGELRAVESAALLRLRAALVIDAHGSWEALPAAVPLRRRTPHAGDLLAFKANFTGSALREGAINVLALDGGYGGMVVADGGVTTVACCLRRDRLCDLRAATAGLPAGVAVQAWLERECGGVRQALRGAVRQGPWLASGPLAPGVRVGAGDGMFRIGNAAGEAHPILGEGMSMALQSAALLCTHLLGERAAGPAPAAAVQAGLQRRYAADWRQLFGPRLRLAAIFAQAALHPGSAAVLMAAVRLWPGLLTQGARWGGKVRLPGPARIPATAPAAASPPAPAASRVP